MFVSYVTVDVDIGGNNTTFRFVDNRTETINLLTVWRERDTTAERQIMLIAIVVSITIHFTVQLIKVIVCVEYSCY